MSAAVAITLALGGSWGLATPAHATGGTAWTLRSAPSASWGGVAYGSGRSFPAGRFVAVSSNSVLTSPDGVTWTSGSGIPIGGWTAITYVGVQFVAVATSGSNVAMTSPDGIAWTAQPGLDVRRNWNAVSYGKDVYVAAGDDWMAYSSDAGVSWTENEYFLRQSHSWESISFADDTFVVVNSDTDGRNSPNRVMTSNDGITWTPHDTGIQMNAWQAVTYGAGLFVAVASSGTDRVMTSPDGVAWTPRTAASVSAWRSVTFGGGQFVAVGEGGAVMTSTNGIVWASQTSGTTGVWRSVTSGPQYVAVGQSSGEPVMTSFISPAPAITTADPVSGPVAGGGPVTIDGAGFLTGASVTVGGNPCASVSVTSATQLTCTLPAGSAGSVSVSVTNPDSQSATSAAAYTYVDSTPPPTPASAPGEVLAVAGDASASVSWAVPSSSGSFPVTNYLVTSTPGGRTCQTSSLTCSVAGLTNGTAYTFTVKALNGAGWSEESAPSNAVMPRAAARPTITMTGSRSGGVISVAGTVTGFGTGAILNPWVKLAGQTTYSQGTAEVLVSLDGTFEWGRKTGKKAYVYVQTPDGSVRSNTVTIPAR